MFIMRMQLFFVPIQTCKPQQCSSLTVALATSADEFPHPTHARTETVDAEIVEGAASAIRSEAQGAEVIGLQPVAADEPSER
jgi:hypothetical protein